MISRRALLTSIAGAVLAAPALRLSVPAAANSIPLPQSEFSEAEFSIQPIRAVQRSGWFRTEIKLDEVDLAKWVRTDPVIAAYKQMKVDES